ncbi:MAG: CHAP domain-containing protein [Lactobacillales bacterium]|jgi:peptidoglycan hydrolase CwlO-like protein|nr:CHAP domain-containing protein [Lactobacillales bacterium]
MKSRGVFFLFLVAISVLFFSLTNDRYVLANDDNIDVEEKNKKIKDLKLQEDKAACEVSSIQKELDQIELRAKDLSEDNAKLTTDIIELDRKIQDLNMIIAKRREQMNKQVRSIQLHNSGISLLKVLIDSESLTDLLTRCCAVACLLHASHSTLNDHLNDVREVQKKSRKSFKRMQQLQMNQAELVISKKIGEQRRADLQVAQVNLAIERTTEEGKRDSLLIQKAQAKDYAEAVAKRQQEEAEQLKKAQQESQVQVVTLETKPEETQPSFSPPPKPTSPTSQEKKKESATSTIAVPKKGGITSGADMNWTVDHGFYWGQCTWYVNNIFNHRIPQTWGNAATWSSAARADGRSVSAIPRTNSVVCYQPGCEGASVFGHVAVVTGVNSDGTYNISESNVEGLGIISSRSNLKPGDGIEFIYM